MSDAQKNKLIPFLDKLTEMQYKIRRVSVSPQYHCEFQDFWRRAVNGCSNVKSGSYNCAFIDLDDNAKRITVEFSENLDTYGCSEDADALAEIIRLLNDGELGEALKEFRRMHSLVNRFLCNACGHISDHSTISKCDECGGDIKVVVVRKAESRTA
jgi:hypothetical protein